MTNYHSLTRQLQAMEGNVTTKFAPGARVELDPASPTNTRHGGPYELKYGDVYVVVDPTKASGTEMTVRNESTGKQWETSFYQTRFKLAPQKDTSQDTTVFGIEGARAGRQRLVNAAIPADRIRIRTRGFDTAGSYFGIDVLDRPATDANAKPVAKLYHQQAVTKYIESQVPEDVAVFMESTRGVTKVYQFRAKDQTTLVSPFDGSYWFSQSDFARLPGGIVTYLGKRYRLGQNKFVPFA